MSTSSSAQALQEMKLTAVERKCHLAQMDSVPFVKYLKMVRVYLGAPRTRG